MAASNTTRITSWLELHRAGESRAREELIAHSCGRLRRLASKMLGGYPKLRRWEQTDDVLQTAMMRLHESLADVRPESVRHYFSLAATQIRRTLIDLGRHHFGPYGDAANHHTDGAAADDPGGSIAKQSSEPASLEDWTGFHEAVERLPAEEREVFNLNWYEGLSQAEAAELLGVTVRTIKRRWRSAKLLLQERLAGQTDG